MYRSYIFIFSLFIALPILSFAGKKHQDLTFLDEISKWEQLIQNENSAFIERDLKINEFLFRFIDNQDETAPFLEDDATSLNILYLKQALYFYRNIVLEGELALQEIRKIVDLKSTLSKKTWHKKKKIKELSERWNLFIDNYEIYLDHLGKKFDEIDFSLIYIALEEIYNANSISPEISIYTQQQFNRFMKKFLANGLTCLNKDDICSICLFPFNPGYSKCKELDKCNHHFHQECWDNFENNTIESQIACPLCRNKIY